MLDVDVVEKALSVRGSRGQVVIRPLYTAVFYVRPWGASSTLRELLVSASDLLGSHLTHAALRDGEQYREWNAAEFSDRFWTWTERPRAGKRYWFDALAGIDEAPGAFLSAFIDMLPNAPRKPLTPTDLATMDAMVAKAVATGETSASEAVDHQRMATGIRTATESGHKPPPGVQDGHLCIGIPLSTFPDPLAFRRWFAARVAASSPCLVSGHAGIGLEWVGDGEDSTDYRQVGQRLSGMLLREPTLDWERTGTSADREWRPFDPRAGFGERRSVKRARWLNLLCPELVSTLGGDESLRAACEGHPGCGYEHLGPNALITAGESPDPTDPNGQRLLEALRHVNRLLQPVQVRSYREPIGAPRDFSTSFLSLGEREPEP
jgi:hypothetical protein